MVHGETSRFVRWLKICGLVLPAGFFLWLGSQYFIVFGSTVYHASFGHSRNAILSLVHEADVVAKRQFRRDDLRWYVASPTVPFTVRFTRLVERATVSLRVSGAQEYITALSAQYSSAIFGTHTTLLRHYQLDALPWEHISAGGLTLWQRPYRLTGSTADAKAVTQYSSINEFFAKHQDFSTAALVDRHSLAYQRIPTYKPSPELRRVEHQLRGSHTMIFYVGAEDIDVRFALRDLNQTAGENRTTVILSRLDDIRLTGQEPLRTIVVSDDGQTDGKKAIGDPQLVQLNIERPEQGYYRLQVISSADTLIQDLQTRQSMFFFETSLSLVDGERVLPGRDVQPATIQVQGVSLTLTTQHTSSPVVAQVDGQPYEVKRGQQKKVTLKNSESPVILPLADLDLRTTGYFTFAGLSLPPHEGGMSVSITTPIDLESVDYILAQYTPQVTTKPISYSVELPMQKLLLKDNRLHLQLDTPGLISRTSTLRVDHTSIKYQREVSLWKKFLRRIGVESI